ncbi:sigma 54-interacting transcriptional regulator [Desulfocastanea catecholica]
MDKKVNNDTVFEEREEFNNASAEPRQMDISLSKIFAAMPDGVVCTDSKRRILMVNPAIEAILGYTAEELLGRRIDFLYSDRKDYEYQGKIQCQCRLDGKTAKNLFETTYRKKDGTFCPVEIMHTVVKGEDGEEIFFIKLIRDISGRRKVEINLRRLEQKFRTVAEFAYDWECWGLLDGTFLYVSPACARITGYSADEFMENPSLFRQIIFPEDRDVWEEHHRDSSNLNIDRREVQFRIIRRDGEIRWIEHACQRVKGDNNELRGFRSSNRDITTRKNNEEQLRQALLEIQHYKEQLEAESAYLRREMKLSCNHDNIIGSSNALQYVLFKIEQIAATDTSVLLLGETGTGKELFARAIHKNSGRKDRPLIKINCATLPANLIESELFGHEKGAFTGAHLRQTGRFELADKATIFLDEIGELPLELQAKLLRVLQEGEFERLGGSRTIKVDVRVIAATNRDLEADVCNGLFRKDLWYRLNVFPITAPPLRDRVDDIPQLVRYFVDIFARKLRKNIDLVPLSVMNQLEKYPWPGNIRELENVIERAVINTSGSTLHLADELKQPNGARTTQLKSLEDMEREYITMVLEKTNWKVSGQNSAAEILGLKRSTLRARMEKHGIRRL